jgi:tRNA (cytidine/uridine-2'-O-)-methyltransferase
VKLRFRPPDPGFHVVLVEPEIPQNTGNVARLCAATGSRLHLVGRLGFRTDEKAARRAGLDYWHLIEVAEHPDLAGCLDAIGGAPPLLFTANTGRDFREAPFDPGRALVFGGESHGLPEQLLAAHRSRTFAIPTGAGSVRSLNLANAVAVVVYEGLGAVGALGDTLVEE